MIDPVLVLGCSGESGKVEVDGRGLRSLAILEG